ncbi:WD repeat-containing protein 76 isoform X2 [Agelaius phoeniceus]|uniref:WD repeat-containing protein 76 isoform X2 n=1 Tax=Agelaius phoeniceus TaxID=39638 RepID=UPI004054B889
MALSQPGPRQPEELAAHRRQQLQESSSPGPADSRSPHQEPSSPGPAEPRSPHQEPCSPGPAGSPSPHQESLLAGPAEPRSPHQEPCSPGPAGSPSPHQELLLAGPAEPRSPPQESLLAGPAEPRSPPQESLPEGPAEPRSPHQESPPAGPSEPRSPPQESRPEGPAEPRSPHQESPPQESPPAGPAEPCSPPQESLLAGLAEPRSPPQESPPAGPAEPRKPPQESRPAGPAEPRSPHQESPPQESRPEGPAEPRSPHQESPHQESPPQESRPEGPAEPRSPHQESPPQESPPAGPAEPCSPPQESLLAGLAKPRSPPQESPPAGPAELQPSAAPGLGRQLRVVLTPLPAAAWPRPQKRLLSARSPAGKRLCLEPDSGPGAAPGSPPGPSSAARGQDGLRDVDSDGSDGGDAAPDGYSHLSAYERKRLKNITENAKFFAALKLHESAARLNQLTTKRQSRVTKRAKPKKVEDEPALRRSMRLLREPPLDIPLLDTFSKPEAEEYPQVPVGPFPMVPEGQAESSKWTEAILSTWMRISEVKVEDAEQGTPDIKRYRESLSSMVLREENIRKVVKSRVCSMAIHPSQSTILVAAGDKLGCVGLWNVSCGTEEGAHTFIPHNFPVNCMHFSPCNPAHLLSLSNDTLRCGDVTRAVFDEICRTEEDFSCFDFLEENACSAIVSHWDGRVAVVDRRTPGVSSELCVDIGFRKTRTVHVHPVNKQYFLAAGSVDVCVFDVRYLRNSKENKPLSSLTGHTKSVTSAYFSPVTGSRVVTVCADDWLRVYDTTSLSSTVTLLSSIRHNNNTGRWLSRFRATWDPKQEHCFLVGSMAQPRQIEVFQDTGKLLHSFYNVDCLGSVCSINVVHPSQSVLVGGNSSGRLHVFK